MSNLSASSHDGLLPDMTKSARPSHDTATGFKLAPVDIQHNFRPHVICLAGLEPDCVRFCLIAYRELPVFTPIVSAQ